MGQSYSVCSGRTIALQWTIPCVPRCVLKHFPMPSLVRWPECDSRPSKKAVTVVDCFAGGMALNPLTNMDEVDAALCAWAAQHLLTRKVTIYGARRRG